MAFHNFISLKPHAFTYAAKIFLGSALAWYGLILCGVDNPIWAAITVVLVSDPDIGTTVTLTKARAINTVIGCVFGLGSLMLFGYSPLRMLLTAGMTVLFVNFFERYPSNWRLAQATVIILMDASRTATTHQMEINYIFLRVAEIATGCIIALALAGVYTHVLKRKFAADRVVASTQPDTANDKPGL